MSLWSNSSCLNLNIFDFKAIFIVCSIRVFPLILRKFLFFKPLDPVLAQITQREFITQYSLQNLLTYYFQNKTSLPQVEKETNDLLKKIKKNKKYVFSLKDIIVLESLKSDGVQILKKYQKLYDYNNNLPSEINTMIVNVETGLVLLKISEIIGEDNLEDLGIESVDYIVSILNELKMVDLRNEILLKVLPFKV